jgi:hypothetical protein
MLGGCHRRCYQEPNPKYQRWPASNLSLGWYVSTFDLLLRRTNPTWHLGGNDAELSKILNQCIFQWAVFNSDQVTKAKTAALANPEYSWAKSYDWDALGRGCAGQLTRTKNIIASAGFSKSLDQVISAAKLKLSSEWVLLVTWSSTTSKSSMFCTDTE